MKSLKHFLPLFLIVTFFSCKSDDNSAPTCTAITWYQDADGDGFGNPDVSEDSCEQPEGYVDNNNDLDDSNNSIGDCLLSTWYQDADGDGFGNPDISEDSCEQPEGYVDNNNDLDDTNRLVTDCIDTNQTWYEDADQDGFGSPNVLVNTCTQPDGYVNNNSDLDDTNNKIWDCTTPWYADSDNDGFGDPLDVIQACNQPNGYVDNDLDLDDNNNRLRDSSETFWFFDGDNDGFGNVEDTIFSSELPDDGANFSLDKDDNDPNVFPILWTGPTVTFNKPSGEDFTLEQFQDRITDMVWLTRGEDKSLFNIKQETEYNELTNTPLGTEWSAGTIQNIREIDNFTNLKNAVSRATGQRGMVSSIDLDMVLHLVEEDIYIDFKIRTWIRGLGNGNSQGGGVVYERSSQAVD